MNKFNRRMLALLKVEWVNRAIFALRFFFFVRIRRKVRVYQNEANVKANKYSINQLIKGKTSSRPLRLVRPLSVIEAVNKNGKTLSIGCRFETELLYLVGYGFDPAGVRGFDMISYSDWVDLGNMHNLPYKDDSWDTVILGWVLPYSDQPEMAIKEVIRVLNDGGVVALGLSAYPQEKIQELLASGQFAIQPDKRVQTSNEWIKMFGNYVDRVYFSHDPLPGNEGTCSAIFSIKKAKREVEFI